MGFFIYFRFFPLRIQVNLQDINAEFLEIPYYYEQYGGDLTMYVFLPSENTPVDELLNNLTTDTIAYVNGYHPTTKVDVEFPKMSLDTTLYLRNVRN